MQICTVLQSVGWMNEWKDKWRIVGKEEGMQGEKRAKMDGDG